MSGPKLLKGEPWFTTLEDMVQASLCGLKSDVALALFHTDLCLSETMRLTLVDVAFGIHYGYMTPEEGAERIAKAHGLTLHRGTVQSHDRLGTTEEAG